MEKRKSASPVIVVFLIVIFIVILGSFGAVYHFNREIETYQNSSIEAIPDEDPDDILLLKSQRHFINPAAEADPHHDYDHHDDALYFFDAPEGFTMASHSEAWNQYKLEMLYQELMLNQYGEEINLLYEVVVHPYEEEEMNMLASFAFGVTIESFFINFPAFPTDFTIDFPKDIGKINLYGGDTKTTVESMAQSLSHEYGHLFTFYHMFNPGKDEYDSLSYTTYAMLREAARFDLITSANPEENYMLERHRYLIEIAAEDYVQLMGSPTTRQVVDFVDVQQILNGAEHPTDISGARNAFPQENMMLPLANDVPGLKEYFYSYINAQPPAPIEDKMEVVLEIRQNVVERNLVTGPHTSVHYVLSWNAPYQNAIYTLVCYDPFNYSGWGTPIKTVHPGQTTSAVIGEYSVERGEQIAFLDDGNAQGTKVFFVVALLPDGTQYISEKLEYTF